MGKAPVRKVLAVRKFTDRDEPRAAFNRIFEDAQRHTDEFNVLMFYGIGGFGKTRLINELSKQLDKYNSDNEDLNKIAHVTYDFSRGTEKMFVLEKLRFLLKKQGLSFPYSDALEAAYNIKCGNPVYKTASEKDLIDNPMISIVAKFIPGASGLLSTLKTGKTIMEETSKYYKKIERMWNVDQQKLDREIKNIGSLEVNELEEKASYYFAQDLISNTESVADDFRLPVVIFLDTYEELVNSYKAIDYAGAYDVWLRDDIIKTVPGVMWVIGGRERLKWEEEDSFWVGAIEQHELGDLTREDSLDFLRTAGIPEYLLDDIYNVTGGTPLFLDLNVTTYYELLAAGKEITRESFGTSKEQVIERFLRYMDPDDQYIAKLLSVLENWSDDEAETIGKATLPVFYKENYNAFIEHTIIIKDNDQRYYMHQQVRKVILDAARNSNPEMVNNIFVEKIKYLCKQDYKNMDPNRKFALAKDVVSVFTQAGFDNSTFSMMFREFYDLSASFFRENSYSRLYEIYKTLYQCVSRSCTSYYSVSYNYAMGCKNYNTHPDYQKLLEDGLKAINNSIASITNKDTSVAAIKKLVRANDVKASILQKLRREEEALTLYKDSYEAIYKTAGANSFEAMRLLNNMAIVYQKRGEYGKASELFIEVYQRAAETLGPENRYTLKSMYGVASSYTDTGDYENALKWHRDCYRLREKNFGRSDGDTLLSLKACASTYYNLEMYDKAIECYQQLLEDCDGKYEGNDYVFMYRYGMACLKTGDHFKAQNVFQLYYDKYAEYYGESGERTLYAIDDILYAYRDDNPEKALNEGLKRLQQWKERYGADSEMYERALYNSALDHAAMKDHETAVNYLKLAREKSDVLYGTDSRHSMSIAFAMGVCYFWLEEFRKALEVNTEYWTYSLNNDGTLSLKSLDVLENMCDDLVFMGNYRQRSLCQKNLLNNYRYKNSTYYRLQFALAYSYLKTEKYSDCLECLKNVYENKDRLLTEYEVMNQYEELGQQNGKLSMITDCELKMLREISQFLEGMDEELYRFYHDALTVREKVISAFPQ